MKPEGLYGEFYCIPTGIYILIDTIGLNIPFKEFIDV
jgi:hypothetical protein